MHGDLILEAVKRLSQQVSQSLDGEYRKPNRRRRPLSPARFKTWKMWHEDGLSIQKIAVSIFFFNFLKLLREKGKKMNVTAWQLETHSHVEVHPCI